MVCLYNTYSKQLILLVVKKLDARIVPSCAKHRFTLEDMTYARVRFRYVVMISRVQCMSKWIPAFSLFTGITIPEDYQGQP